MTAKAYAQGDVLLVRVPDLMPSPDRIVKTADGVVVLAEGERTGHRHAFYSGATFFRDEELALDVDPGVYAGHVIVAPGGATLEHGPGPGLKGDHEALHLPGGTFLVLRQREYHAGEGRRVRD